MKCCLLNLALRSESMNKERESAVPFPTLSTDTKAPLSWAPETKAAQMKLCKRLCLCVHTAKLQIPNSADGSAEDFAVLQADPEQVSC